MHLVAVVDGRGRGPKTLRDDLSAVEATPRILRTDPDERVRSVQLQGHHRREVHDRQFPSSTPRQAKRRGAAALDPAGYGVRVTSTTAACASTPVIASPSSDADG